MSGQNPYLIEFGGLEDGVHEFEYTVDDSFFARFENSIVQHGEIDVLVTLEKEPGILMLDFTFSGTITTTCDRCLDDLEVELEGFNELIIRFGEVTAEEAEQSEVDIITLSAREHEVDISDLLFEYISLQVPLRNVHPDDEDGKSTCNAEVLKEMEKHLSQTPPDDHRWDALKNINLN
jgi:uncharacterized metal-binding protein YceD (DUF177 family)